MIGFFRTKMRPQMPDTRSHTERTRDHFTGMEVRLQNRIDNLKDTIKRATDDLNESEAILRSVMAAQHSLDAHIGALLNAQEVEIELALADLSVKD